MTARFKKALISINQLDWCAQDNDVAWDLLLKAGNATAYVGIAVLEDAGNFVDCVVDGRKVMVFVDPSAPFDLDLLALRDALNAADAKAGGGAWSICSYTLSSSHRVPCALTAGDVSGIVRTLIAASPPGKLARCYAAAIEAGDMCVIDQVLKVAEVSEGLLAEVMRMDADRDARRVG